MLALASLDHSLVKLRAMSEICVSLTGQTLCPCSEGFDDPHPNFYRDIGRYPAIFLIDRSGRLQSAPRPDQPFEKLEAVVDALLSNRS